MAGFAVRPTLVAALQGGIVAAVLNYGVWLVAHALGVDFIARFEGPDAPTGPLPLPAIGFASVVPAFVAAGVLLLLDRWTRRGAQIFLAVAVVFTLASFASPHLLPDASLGTRLALDAMHVVAAVSIVYALLTRGRRL
jgi:hypothetical protein